MNDRKSKKGFIKQLFCNHNWVNEFEFFEVLPPEEEFNEGIGWFICSECGKEKYDITLEFKRAKEALPELIKTWSKIK